MKKTSRNLTRAERKIRNENLLKDYELLIGAGVAKMDAQKTLREKYNLTGLNSVGSIIYSQKPETVEP